MSLPGYSLAGTSATRERVKDDFYATPYETTRALLQVETIRGSILEPACGQGHISKILKEFYPEQEVISTDLINRGYGESPVDFLSYNYGRKFDNCITNPPFKFAKEFIEKALEITTDKVMMLCKIQLLEGKARKEMFSRTPLKYIYVFTSRQSTWNNGNQLDENGKPWATTMCLAWFLWEHGYTGEPIVRWL